MRIWLQNFVSIQPRTSLEKSDVSWPRGCRRLEQNHGDDPALVFEHPEQHAHDLVRDLLQEAHGPVKVMRGRAHQAGRQLRHRLPCAGARRLHSRRANE